MPFNFQSIPEVGMPLGGFFPQARQMDPRAAAQAAWLNSGGRGAPVAPAPAQDTNGWTDEDWQIAVMSGADPMGVREAFERYRGVNDEQAFIEGLGKINWRDPASKGQVGQLLTRFPRGVTQKGLGIMQMLDKLEEPDKDVYRPQVAELGTEYLQAYDAALKGGADKETALAAATTMRQKNLVAEKTKQDVRSKFVEAGGDLDKFDDLSQQYGTDWAGYRDYLNKNKPLAKLEAGERKALTEAYDNYRSTLASVDEAATDDAKISAFTKAKGRAPQTQADWSEAYNLVKESMVAPAVTQLTDLADLYEGKALPEVVTRLVRPSGSLFPATQSPAGASLAPQAPMTAPAAPSIVAPVQASPMAPPTVAPSAGVAPTIPPAVSRADLTRGDLYNPPVAAPVTFGSIQQQVAERGAAERRRREEEFLARQKVKEGRAPGFEKWEEAKNQIMQVVTPEDVGLSMSDETKNPYALLSRLGKRPEDTAFTDPNGKRVTWEGALAALLEDPRWKQISGGKEAVSAAVPAKDYSYLYGGKGSK